MKDNQSTGEPKYVSGRNGLSKEIRKNKVDESSKKRTRKDYISDPHVPVSTAKDEQPRFSAEQRKLLSKFQKAVIKLDKSIKTKFEASRHCADIKADINRLTERLVKSRSKKKIFDRIEDLKVLYRKLRKEELEIDKQSNSIRVQNGKIEKLKSELFG